MRAQLISENIEFKRGIGSKEALSIGKIANPLILMNFQEEHSEDGPILKPSDFPENQNTWDEEVDYPEAHNILANWKKYAHKYHSALIMRRDEDDDEYEHVLAPELEGEYVQYDGETYYIPETGMIAESVDFKRNKNSKRALSVGDHRPFETGDKFRLLKDLYWVPLPDETWRPVPMDDHPSDPIYAGDEFTFTGYETFDDEWVKTKDQNGKAQHFKLSWIYDHLNHYLKRI
jgi:hypothetical protein